MQISYSNGVILELKLLSNTEQSIVMPWEDNCFKGFVWKHYRICPCTSLSPWFIILDKNKFVKVSHPYWIPICIQYNGMAICIWGKFFRETTPDGHTETPKSSFFPYTQKVGEMVIMNDLGWPMLSHYVTYYETFSKLMQQTEKEALRLYKTI